MLVLSSCSNYRAMRENLSLCCMLQFHHLVSMSLDLQHIQPVHDHHRFDQIPFQVHMPASSMSAHDLLQVRE